MDFYNFPPAAEFVDRLGIVRPIAHCSLLGREEFKERMIQLQSLLADYPGDWQDLYEGDRQFQHAVERCLRLCGIDPDWVSLPMIEKLLFIPGHLVQINLVKGGDSQGTADEEGMTAIDLIGLLANQHGLETALRLAQNTPLDLLTDVMSAQHELSQPRKRKRRKPIDRAELDRLLDMPIDQLQEV